jgi:hypothetical protein
LVGHLTQVAIMKLETGNWTVLTRNSACGYIQELSWSPDGTRIYYDRRTDVSHGVFSIPALGGDEHMVLQDAESPQALADGSLLVFRWNSRRMQQLFRYWPENGKFRPFPVEVVRSDAHPIPIRVFPDARSAVVIGRPILPTPYPSSSLLVLVDLVLGGVRVLDNAAVPPFSLAIALDRKSIFAGTMSGDSSKVEEFRFGGAQRKRTLLSATHPMHLDTGPDGSLYADEVDRPSTRVRFSASGGAIQTIGCEGGDRALLPDCQIVVTERARGRRHLIGLGTEKNPAPIVNALDKTYVPATALGRSEMAFISTVPSLEPYSEVAIADRSTGAISRRIAFDKGSITSLAATPDGTTIFIAAGGNVWSIPSAGGQPRVIRTGDSVGIDPSGTFLVVQVIESPETRLVRVPLDGGAEQEIRLIGTYHLSSTPINSQMIADDGRLVVSLVSPDSWFVSPGIIDLATGLATRIPVDGHYDYLFTAWAPDGSILSTARGLRSNLWRFQEASR